jgi:hypothetical protein
MSELGDLTEFLADPSNGSNPEIKFGSSIVDHSWLDVDREEYRKTEPVPMQNLDIQPDLEALWDHADKPSSAYVVPNQGAPRTMGDMSRDHGPLRAKPADIVRAMKMAMMQSTDPRFIHAALAGMFDSDSIKAARPLMAKASLERGLLGSVYVDSKDFPDCANGEGLDFVRKHTSKARYVLRKDACSGCTACQHSGGATCSNFHKEIVVNVPYTPDLAEAVERAEQAGGKLIAKNASQSPRERIKAAVLAERAPLPGSAPKPVEHTARQLKVIQPNQQAAMNRMAAEKRAAPVVELLRREMLKGRQEADLQVALKLAFEVRDLVETKPIWYPVYRQAGLYGVAYTTQDSFSDCREGADFLARHNPSVKAVVAGSKCSGCIYAKVNRCMMYGKPLVASAGQAVTSEVVQSVAQEHLMTGRLASVQGLPSEPVQALRALYKAASKPQKVAIKANNQTAFTGNTQGHHTSSVVTRDIVAATQRYMNEGLYGADLLRVLRSRFEVRDLKAASAAIKKATAEQGLMGVYYVDPSVYADYGKGCNEAERLHRTRLVAYAKVGKACSSCVYQIQTGKCAKLDKQLVVEPPYENKTAQQREMLASGPATEINYESLVNNGHAAMQEYELAERAMVASVDDPIQTIEASVQFGVQEITL